MSKFKNVMEILTLLDKSNCRKCNETTCMAFAASVFQGRRQLADCPHISHEVLKTYGVQDVRESQLESDMDKIMEDLKARIKEMDLAEAAKRIGGDYNGKKLTVKVLGKPFSVDGEGKIYSDIHVNPWVAIPFLSYVLESKGIPLSGRWVTIREVKGGQDWANFFTYQCVEPMKKLADNYTDLFQDMIDIFNGKPVGKEFQSDISIVLYPLPLVPMLICYWRPDEGMPSDLKIFFDAHAGDNLHIQRIYALGTGLLTMFRKLTLTHGIG